MAAETEARRIVYRKQVPLFRLLQKMKLWPSRNGLLHGIQFFEAVGEYVQILTHCRKRMTVRNSKRSRSARWLRNQRFYGACPECRIPDWKMEKYLSTQFRRHWGSQLREPPEKREETSD